MFLLPMADGLGLQVLFCWPGRQQFLLAARKYASEHDRLTTIALQCEVNKPELLASTSPHKQEHKRWLSNRVGYSLHILQQNSVCHAVPLINYLLLPTVLLHGENNASSTLHWTLSLGPIWLLLMFYQYMLLHHRWKSLHTFPQE